MNLEILNKYHKEGLLYKQTHPTLPLTIWNYSPDVQYGKKWDEVTLQCRGLVTDGKGNVVARPFKKFFNIEEQMHTPTKEFEVYEKMDGSLGIVFCYGGTWHIATRGSFTSDQSIKGKELLSKYNLDFLSPGYTYLFEIIYNENRIVCNYDFEDLVMLACIETTDGGEVDIHSGYYSQEFNIVKKYNDIVDYTKLKHMVDDNAEGFVIKFSNGERMKVKGEEYVRLHKIMTQISTTAVWEVLSEGGDMADYLIDVPDEFYDKIREYETELKDSFWSIEFLSKDIFRTVYDEGLTNKEFSMKIKQFPKVYQSLLWAQFNIKMENYSSTIWRYLKPEYKPL